MFGIVFPGLVSAVYMVVNLHSFENGLCEKDCNKHPSIGLLAASNSHAFERVRHSIATEVTQL